MFCKKNWGVSSGDDVLFWVFCLFGLEVIFFCMKEAEVASWKRLKHPGTPGVGSGG